MFGLGLLSALFPLFAALAGGGGLWTKCITFPLTSKKILMSREE